MIAALASVLLALAAAQPQRSGVAHPPAAHEEETVSRFQKIAAEAKQAQAEDRVDDAERLYGEGVKLKPDWDEGLWNLATLLYEKDKYFDACDVFRRFLARNPKAGPGWAMLGMSEYESRQYTRALEDLDQAIALGLGGNKDFGLTAYYIAAVLLTRAERFDQSMALQYELIQSGRGEDALVESLGLAALRLPLLPAEIPAARRPLIRLVGAAAYEIQAQHYAEAEKLLDELKAKYPGEPGVHFFVGAYLLEHRPDDGIKEMGREIEISPSHVPARIRLSEESLKRGEKERAIALAWEAVKLAPADPLTHLILGEALAASSDANGAIKELETARDGAPKLDRVHWDLVRAYTAAGRSEDANREKTELENLGKQNPEAGR
jgi:tetratricopeptide (TPR) repeat protein